MTSSMLAPGLQLRSTGGLNRHPDRRTYSHDPDPTDRALADSYGRPVVIGFAADPTGKWTAGFDTQIGQQNYTYEFKVADFLTEELVAKRAK